MNAAASHTENTVAPVCFEVPEAAWQRLQRCLGRQLATGEAWDEGMAHGVGVHTLTRLAQHWLLGFELLEQPLFRLPCFRFQLGEHDLGFLHVRSRAPGALPLLLLHGLGSSPAEFQGIVEPLTEPSDGDAVVAFHLVAPGLPGFGLSAGPACVRSAAEACAQLMAHLGYPRYLVHGSELGGRVAAELADLDAAHVAGVLVSTLPAGTPSPSDFDLLDCAEKSRLARLIECHEQLSLERPESPLSQLAFALAQLDEDTGVHERRSAVDALLTGLTLSWTLGEARLRREVYGSQLVPAQARSRVPVAVHSFPLAMPTLRRFAEVRYRVVEWVEHTTGGSAPALEQPETLIEVLRGFFGRFA